MKSPALHSLIYVLTLFFLCFSELVPNLCNGAGNYGISASVSTEFFAGPFVKPVYLTHAGDGTGRLFLIEQRGKVFLIKKGKVIKRPFLDITHRVRCCGERGLLSIAFSPKFKKNRMFYVDYTDKSGATVIARYHVTADNPDIADPENKEILLTISQPYANHNGGLVLFGPDGFLYIGTGDGGAGGDPGNRAQNLNTLLGKLLRIDVESGMKPYSIPENNPFSTNKKGRPEIWAYGLRNPWRFSFDRLTGDLYIADVGQDDYEEIDVQPSLSKGGENYGWRIMEGLHCFNPPRCDRSGLVPPVHEYDHSKGCSITGGLVCRGAHYTLLQGTYIFGDYCSGKIWGLKKIGDRWKRLLLTNTKFAISSFGEDGEGNLYVLDYKGGKAYRIVELHETEIKRAIQQ